MNTGKEMETKFGTSKQKCMLDMFSKYETFFSLIQPGLILSTTGTFNAYLMLTGGQNMMKLSGKTHWINIYNLFKLGSQSS